MDLNSFFDAMEELSTAMFPGQLGKCDALIDLALDNLKDITPVAKTAVIAEKGYMGSTKNPRRAQESTLARLIDQ